MIEIKHIWLTRLLVCAKVRSPCTHQYVPSVHNLLLSTNLLPVFSKYERQKFAKIVTGESLEMHFYEPLHRIDKYERDCCSSEECDKEIKVTEVERLDLKQ